MTSLRRICVLMMLVALGTSLAAACTGDDGDGPAEPSSTTHGEGVVNEDTGATAFIAGRFAYGFNDISAQASFDGNVATLDVRNGTGSELGAPALYVLGTDDQRYDGVADGIAPIPDGQQVSLEFSFPDAVSPQTIGLAVLMFGEDNVGAMAPVPSSG